MVKKIYEDQNIVVVDKPAGLVVHQGAGEHERTLSDWLIKNYPDTAREMWPDRARAGIVHRLDKDTSGLIILAKNPRSLETMQQLFKEKQIEKKYLTLVYGELEKPEGEITGYIGRDPHARRKQTSKSIVFDFESGQHRESKTCYRVVKQYQYEKSDLSLIEAKLETGRMHQIRVHFKSIGHPVIGDQTYNIKHSRLISKRLGLNHQFLHAYKLSFINPFSGTAVNLESPLPNDLNDILIKLNE